MGAAVYATTGRHADAPAPGGISLARGVFPRDASNPGRARTWRNANSLANEVIVLRARIGKLLAL